jgi:hypothetical protein
VTDIRGTQCDRCGRTLEPAKSFRMAVALPSGERIERQLCLTCAAAVRRFLLGREPDTAEPLEEPGPLARSSWFLARQAIYALIALTMFAIVTWLISR